MSPVHTKGAGGGYWYYYVPIALLVIFVALVFAFGLVELR